MKHSLVLLQCCSCTESTSSSLLRICLVLGLNDGDGEQQAVASSKNAFRFFSFSDLLQCLARSELNASEILRSRTRFLKELNAEQVLCGAARTLARTSSV
jgi:hypothetical protein